MMKDNGRPELKKVIILDDLDIEILKDGKDAVQRFLLGIECDTNKIFKLIGWIDIKVGVDYGQ